MSQQMQEFLELVECPVCGGDRFTVIEPACYPGGMDTGDEGWNVLEITLFWQTLPLAYVLERAAPYFGVFGALQRVVTKVGLASLGLTYNLSQSLCVARKGSDRNSGS